MNRNSEAPAMTFRKGALTAARPSPICVIGDIFGFLLSLQGQLTIWRVHRMTILAIFVATLFLKSKAEKQPSEIVVYPDAPHGFHADYRDSYRGQAATDGWKRLVAWLNQHGVR